MYVTHAHRVRYNLAPRTNFQPEVAQQNVCNLEQANELAQEEVRLSVGEHSNSFKSAAIST